MRRVLLGLFLGVAACSSEPELLDQEALMNPASCENCHPDHTREWSGSMHAYAADDPLFLAMNARGQRETQGALGDFCVQCHAPMAVRTGATKDGLNLAELPQHLKGVTCYFCHSVEAVTGTHNSPIVLANDGVMRGAITDPQGEMRHLAGYSPLLDRTSADSAKLCGSCHDIVTPRGVHLERTYAEWQASLFAKNIPGQRLTCGQCHMDGRDGLAADAPGVALRRVHDHAMPGVDIALTPFAESEAQRAAVQRSLDSALIVKLCVKPYGGGVEAVVSLDNAFAGHMWPSGSAQDRRAFTELVATSGGQVIYESGVVPEGVAATTIADPDLWLLRDRTLDEMGGDAHMFWDVASYESKLLPPAVTNDPADPAYYHAVERSYRITSAIPDRITMRTSIRPVGLDVVDDLIASGDLDPAIRDKMPTFVLAPSKLEWTPDLGFGCVP